MTDEYPPVEYLNPGTLHQNPAFSQVVVTRGSLKTVYVGGQNAVASDGRIIGKGNIREQAAQVLENLKAALQAGGAGLDQVIKWTVYVVQGQDSGEAFQAFQQEIRRMPHAPLISVLYVSGLAHPDFLLEMEAIAVVPE